MHVDSYLSFEDVNVELKNEIPKYQTRNPFCICVWSIWVWEWLSKPLFEENGSQSRGITY